MKVVLAYSGGLDTSVIIQWLIDRYNAEVIAFSADLGQEEELDGLEQKAIRTGAKACFVEDLREEFAKDFVFPILRANAIYEDTYLLGTSIARPLIAKRMVEIARREGAEAVSHGATGKGNDQVRFELTAYALEPGIKVIAPWREWDMTSREDLIAYAEKLGVPVPVTRAKPYSSDRNLLHISFEGGILEDPWNAPPEDMFLLTVAPEKAPDTPEIVEIQYDGGNPVALNGEALSPAQLIMKLNKIAGRNGVGRIDIVENRFVGMKSRGVYETPAGTVLRLAHQAVESLTLDREVVHLRDSLIPKYAELVYNGFWYAPEREFLQAAIDSSQKRVNGTARLKLYKGHCMVVGRKAPKSLYVPSIASFTMGADYDQKDAEGFIRIQALRLRTRAQSQGGPA